MQKCVWDGVQGWGALSHGLAPDMPTPAALPHPPLSATSICMRPQVSFPTFTGAGLGTLCWALASLSLRPPNFWIEDCLTWAGKRLAAIPLVRGYARLHGSACLVIPCFSFCQAEAAGGGLPAAHLSSTQTWPTDC